jgi:hypothetical protein
MSNSLDGYALSVIQEHKQQQAATTSTSADSNANASKAKSTDNVQEHKQPSTQQAAKSKPKSSPQQQKKQDKEGVHVVGKAQAQLLFQHALRVKDITEQRRITAQQREQDAKDPRKNWIRYEKLICIGHDSQVLLLKEPKQPFGVEIHVKLDLDEKGKEKECDPRDVDEPVQKRFPGATGSSMLTKMLQQHGFEVKITKTASRFSVFGFNSGCTGAHVVSALMYDLANIPDEALGLQILHSKPTWIFTENSSYNFEAVLYYFRDTQHLGEYDVEECLEKAEKRRQAATQQAAEKRGSTTLLRS